MLCWTRNKKEREKVGHSCLTLMRPDKRVFIHIFEDKYLGLDHKEKVKE